LVVGHGPGSEEPTWDVVIRYIEIMGGAAKYLHDDER
jgi:hypothetical protein